MVNENAANGTAVGITASASDADATNNTITYSLDDDAGGRFAIHVATGVVIVTGVLDCEATSSHTIIVRATSSDGSFATHNVAITVLDLNDNAPVVVHNNLVIAEGETATLTSGNLQSTDPDGIAAVLTYTVGGVTGGRFERAASPGVSMTLFTQLEVDLGQIVFVHDGGELAPAYEITVSDGVFVVGPQAATVSFTNVNDAPRAANISFEVGTSVLLGGVMPWIVDADGDSLSVLLFAAPTGGTVHLAPDGTFSYTPTSLFVGADSFAYQASDGLSTSNVAVVTITVTPDVIPPSPPGDGDVSPGEDPPSSDDSSDDSISDSSDDVEGGEDNLLAPEAAPRLPNSTAEVIDAGGGPDASPPTSDLETQHEPIQTVLAPARGEATFGAMRQSHPETDSDTDSPTSREDGRGGDTAATESHTFVHLGQSGRLWRDLDEFHKSLESDLELSTIAIGSVGTIASGFTVGYVLWVLRSGLLLSSVLASLPVWTMFDPLVIVSESGPREEEQEESLEEIVETQATWTAGRPHQDSHTEPRHEMVKPPVANHSCHGQRRGRFDLSGQHVGADAGRRSSDAQGTSRAMRVDRAERFRVGRAWRHGGDGSIAAGRGRPR